MTPSIFDLTSVTPAPPVTAQIPGMGSIICDEFALSNDQVPEFVLHWGQRNFILNLGGAGVTLTPPIQCNR